MRERDRFIFLAADDCGSAILRESLSRSAGLRGEKVGDDEVDDEVETAADELDVALWRAADAGGE